MPHKTVSGVYAIRHDPTGRFYIGSATSLLKRLAEHRRLLRSGAHPNQKLQRSWAAHGEGEFSLFLVEQHAPEHCVSAEQWWIDLLRPYYNIVRRAGSTLGHRHSAVTRAKIGARALGRPVSAETRSRLSAAGRGKPKSAEWRAKMALSHTGRRHTDETKAKLRAMRLGVRPSEETRHKMSMSRKGKPRNPDAVRRSWETRRLRASLA